MKFDIASLEQYWGNLTERERWLSIGMVLFLWIYIYIGWIYLPIMHAVENAQNKIAANYKVLKLMEQAKAYLKNPNQQETLNKSELNKLEALSLISNSLQQSNLNPMTHQLQQASGDEIALSFDAVPYVWLMQWLWKFNQKYQFTIKQLIIDQTPKQGVVRARLIFS